MSSKDMFRKEQRFSFRKFSFGLASAVIANVIFGGAIASSPVVHANTATETAAVNAGEAGPAQSNQRSVSLSYVVNLVDQAGQAISVQTKTLEVTSDQATATATADLAADLVPAGYTAVSGLGQVTLTENAENVFTVVVEKVAAATENPAVASTGAEVKPEAVNQEQATPADKTNLEQLISETSLLIPEGEKQAKDNAELTTAVQAAKPVLEAAQAVFADATATAEQVAAQEAALRAANKAIGDQLALLSEDGTVSVSLNVNNTNGRTNLNIRTDYTVSWTNASVDRTATNPNTGANYRPDAGLSWATDANGNKALVYKYNMSNPTAFTSEDILKLLTAEPTDSTQRTLLGTEKEKIEAGRDGYVKQGQAYTLNGANIQALDITDTDHGWGGRTANDTKVKDLGQSERTQFTIPGTNGVGDLTVTANGDEKFLSYSKLMLVNTNMPVSNGAISGSYVNNTTQTNLYNVYMVGYKEVDMPTIGVNPNVKPNNNDSRKLEVLHVFGNVTGTTETETGKTTKVVIQDNGQERIEVATPVFNTAEATKAFPVTNPEKETVTLTYGVPGNITAYEAGNPDSLTAKDSELISAETKNIGVPNTTQLLLNDEGKLTGELALNPGQFYSRIIKVTDSAGNVLSYSNPFYVITYTDKRADNTDLTVATASDLTEANIFGKLTIDTVDGSVNPALTVPTSEYTRTIVGYRLTGTTDEKTLSTATLNTLPAGQNYEIKVATTNPYGQTIYNWVPVNDRRTAGTDKKPLYVFNNTPIKTVDAGTNVDSSTADDKVKVVTLKDPDGINSVVVSRETDVNTGVFNPASIGITIDTDGNASGTPAVGAIGVYSRGLTVIDGTWTTTNLFPRNNEMYTYVLDATAGATITKAVGGSVTEQEILDNVTVNTGNSNTTDAAIDTRYRKVLAPGETVPTAPGEYDVKVRVITASNVYKDVPVKVIIDKYSDKLTATATENTSLVPGSGTAATQPIVINDANNNPTTAPAGTTYEIDPAFKAEKEALGYEISVSPTGEVSVKAPAGQEADITVPVTVTYPDKTTDSVSLPFKVEQTDLAQLKAEEAIDEKLADETKDLEDKKNAEIAAITNNPDLTQEQKDAAIQDITDAAEIAQKALNDAAGVAKDNVAAATTPEEAKAAQTAGETTLANLENGAEAALDLITAKAEATDAINDKLADEVKDLEAKQAEAEKAIDASTMTPEEKAAAKEALQDVVDAEKAKLEDAAKAATDAIAAATSPADVKAAEIAGETALTEAGTKAEEPIDLIIAKTEAKDAIANKLADEIKDLEAKQAEAEKAIDASTMTPEEKAAAKEALQDVVDAEKAKLEDAAKKATDAIDVATTPADVAGATKAGQDDLTEKGSNAEKAVELAKDKELAKEAIRTEAEEATKAAEKLAEDAIKAINDNPNLTDAEKQAEIDKVNDAAKDALDAIADNAKAATEAAENAQALADLEAAKKAQKDADQAAIDTATPLVDAAVLEAAKQDALNKLEDDAAKAKETIAANPNLSDKEVEKALADLEKDLAKAKDAVNTATTPEAVQTAEDKGVDVIAGDVLDAAQLDALNKLEEDTKETVAAIESNPNLTADEKAAAIAKVEEKADDAKSDILTAETPEAVQAVEEKADKDLAKEELKAAADDAKKAIDANPNLTPEEKQVAKDAVDAKVKNATDAIDAATTPADVNAATLAGEKELAKAEVAAATDDAKKAIDANPNLTPEEKQAAKDALDVEVAKATDAIDKATTPAAVNTATLAGEKVAAKAEVAAAADDAIAAINANPNLDDTAKAAAIKAVEDAAKTATEAIDAAKTPADVNAATLAGEQAVAKAEVAAAAADAVEAIKANPNLDEKAKAAAIKAVEDAAKTATDAIDAAKTPADVNAATLAGEQAV
ncbi:TPA: DUF1542 domain-containing protein, partial [Streptococcus suis]